MTQTLSSKVISDKQPEFCITCHININNKHVIVYVFTTKLATANSVAVKAIHKILTELPKPYATILCSDANFQSANWNDCTGPDNQENQIRGIFEKYHFTQAVRFPRWGNNILDLMFSKAVNIIKYRRKVNWNLQLLRRQDYRHHT